MNPPLVPAVWQAEDMAAQLQRQRAAWMAEGPVTAAVRQDRLQRCIDLLHTHSDAICDVISQDFGGRPAATTLVMDVQTPIAHLKYARDHVRQWMRPQRRATLFPLNWLGARAQLHYQPKGVVGIAGTWNVPLFMLFGPLAGVLAAGNRAMLKPSDLSPITSAWLAEVVPQYFDPLELCVVTGDVSTAQAFTRQAFDHLVFTGSTQVAKQVMRDAAEHLVPLTLELGGKSPAIVSASANLQKTVASLVMARVQNAGQVCVMPDTVYVPRVQLEAFLAEFRLQWQQALPRTTGCADMAAVAHVRHLARVEQKIQEAESAGARVETLGEAVDEGAARDRRRPLRLVVQPPADTAIAQEEIFGQAMVVQPYDEVAQVVQRIQEGPRPLALYYYGQDRAEQDYVLGHTLSGGVCINDAMLHVGMPDLPFGGIGASGMGRYNGPEGFQEFSHLRSVFYAGWWDPRKALGMLPPYSDKLLRRLKQFL